MYSDRSPRRKTLEQHGIFVWNFGPVNNFLKKHFDVLKFKTRSIWDLRKFHFWVVLYGGTWMPNLYKIFFNILLLFIYLIFLLFYILFQFFWKMIIFCFEGVKKGTVARNGLKPHGSSASLLKPIMKTTPNQQTYHIL